MIERDPIRPSIGVQARRQNGRRTTIVTAILDFDSFEKAMEFTGLVTSFLNREMPVETELPTNGEIVKMDDAT